MSVPTGLLTLLATGKPFNMAYSQKRLLDIALAIYFADKFERSFCTGL